MPITLVQCICGKEWIKEDQLCCKYCEHAIEVDVLISVLLEKIKQLEGINPEHLHRRLYHLQQIQNRLTNVVVKTLTDHLERGIRQ